MFRCSYLLPLALVALSATSRAEDQLDLDSAIAEAREHNPLLHRAQAAADEASWRPVEAISNHIPKLSITGNHLFAVKYQILNVNFGGNPVAFPEIYPGTLLSFVANWTVFDGLSTINSFSAAKHGEKAAALEASRAEFQLESDVRLKFYQALGARLLSSVADLNVKTLEDHLTKAKALLASGEATRFDTLRIQVQLEEAIPEQMSARDNVVIARNALAQAMGSEHDSRELMGQLPVPSAAMIPVDLALDVKARPDLEANDERAEAADRAHAAASGAWAPKIGLFAEKDFYNNTNLSLTNTSAYSDAYSFGFGLTWNVFDGGATLARQKEAAYQRVQADDTAAAARLQAPNDFEMWKRKFIYNASYYQARSRAIDTAEESLRLARIGFAAGTRTSTDVLDAELDLFRARAGVIQAQLDAAQAYLNLELTLGRRIANANR